jgi:hypothetical protein
MHQRAPDFDGRPAPLPIGPMDLRGPCPGHLAMAVDLMAQA